MDILCSKSDGILTLEFNRLERKNAITGAMYQTLADALVAAETDTEVRAIMLCGKREIFTAGNDLDDFMKTARPKDGSLDHDRRCSSSCAPCTVAANRWWRRCPVRRSASAPPC